MKPMFKNRDYSKSFLVMTIVVILISVSSAAAAAVAPPRSAAEILLGSYQTNQTQLAASSFGLPLVLESYARGNKVHVDVYGIFDSPFSNVVQVLQVPANWCDIVSLHPNVKACTFRKEPGDWLLTFYFGRKFYQAPEEAQQVIYHFQNVVQKKTYMDIMLNAEDGPFGTDKHKMRFEALPLSGDRTFVHVSYEYNETLALRLAGKAYFSTLGQGKVGFTVIGNDGSGKDIYVGGPRGAIERNAVRYYFAIQTFMTTLHSPDKSLFSRRINNWYDLTARYKEQLFDLDKQDYLTLKTSEHKNQLTLQRQIGPAL